jgi:hypothetical protein
MTIQGDVTSLNNRLAMWRYVTEFIDIALFDGII